MEKIIKTIIRNPLIAQDWIDYIDRKKNNKISYMIAVQDFINNFCYDKENVIKTLIKKHIYLDNKYTIIKVEGLKHKIKDLQVLINLLSNGQNNQIQIETENGNLFLIGKNLRNKVINNIKQIFSYKNYGQIKLTLYNINKLNGFYQFNSYYYFDYKYNLFPIIEILKNNYNYKIIYNGNKFIGLKKDKINNKKIYIEKKVKNYKQYDYIINNLKIDKFIKQNKDFFII